MTDHDSAAIDAALEAIPCSCDPADTSGGTVHRTWCDTNLPPIVIERMLTAARPHLASTNQATITNLRNALKAAAAEMDRRYEMGAAAERERIARLADQHHAHYDCDIPDYGEPFAALIRAEPAAQEAPQQRVVICGCTQVPELGPCPHNRQAAP